MLRSKSLILFMIAIFVIASSAFAGENGETTVSGFADASYQGVMDTKANGFSFDQFEIDLCHKVNDQAMIRADLDTPGDGDLDIEQAYLNYYLPNNDMFSFTFGKFNAPIGFEALDAPDMYQASHSLVFNLLLPTNLTGVMVNADINEMFSASVYVVNGWDQNAEAEDHKNYGTHIGIKINEDLNFGVSAIMGRDDGLGINSRTVIDFDATYKAMENLLVGAEFNMYSATDAADTDYSCMGLMVMGHYDFTDMYGLTLRYDTVSDDADNPYLFPAVGTETLTFSSLTLAPTINLGNGMGAIVEYRMDMCDQDIFIDNAGDADGSQSTIVFELTYTF